LAPEARAGQILTGRRALLLSMATALLSQRRLAGPELADWLSRVPHEEEAGPTTASMQRAGGHVDPPESRDSSP
ncbi:MAG: hypothetical protein V7668_18675, partial [Cereibacter changlensis]